MSGSLTLLDTIKLSFRSAGSYTGTLEAKLQVVLPEGITNESQRKDGFPLGVSLSCAGLSWDLNTHGVYSYTPDSNVLFPGLLSALHHPEHSQVAVSLQVVVPDP